MNSIPQILAACSPDQRAQIVQSLPAPYVRMLNLEFSLWAHDGQLPPPGDWRTWVIMAGRGFGKTRAGSEWVLEMARASGPSARIALVAATFAEARAVMVEGASGLIACARPGEIAAWSPARGELNFASGVQAFLYSGSSAEKLRGPEHDFAWCDELAKWPQAETSWSNLQLGLRRGSQPRALVTTTPRAVPLLAQILAAAGTVQTGGPSRANRHLPQAHLAAVEAQFGGTRLGAQELEGILLRDVEGSLWPGALIEQCRVTAPPALTRIVIGVDPPISVNGTCGIVVAGVCKEGFAYVLADASVAGRSPEGWARAVSDAALTHGADRIIVEANQGGDMVASVLRAACASLPIETVHARRGKAARAEPIAALFESKRAYFAGHFADLEAQLSGLQIGGSYAGPGASPDRADACVWAMTALMLKPERAQPRIRFL